MSGLLGSAQWMYASGAAVTQQSLKFNDDENPYLLRTPTTAGNRQTWSISMWVKRGNLGISQAQLFEAGTSGGSGSRLFWYLNSSDQIQLSSGTVNYGASGARSLRDPSAWYHILIQCSGGSIKHYINGELDITHSISGDTAVNSLVPHAIFSRADSTGTNSMDGYVAQVALFDGTAYTTADVTNTENGVLTVKSDLSSLTFGTNGFHLTFQDDVVSEGFNAVTYRGTGTSQSVSGLGLAADLVWIKGRNVAGSPLVYDSVRGATKYLQTNSTSGEGTGADSQTSFDSDGFSVGADSSTTGVNNSGSTYVAWAWDAGGAPTADNSAGAGATPTAGSVKIDGSNKSGAFSGSPNIAVTRLSANTARGFSIVTYTGSSNTSFPHGLSSAPKLVIIKQRSGTAQWAVYHTGLSSTSHYLNLDDSDAEASYGSAFISPDSNTITIDASSSLLNANSSTYVAYCFAEVAGYSSIGSYSGTGAAGNVVTTGFPVAFVMIKATSISGEAWWMFDNTRSTTDPRTKHLRANTSGAEITDASAALDFTSTGFEHQSSQDGLNKSGTTYLYYAVADSREAAFWKDVSGQGNHWTPSGLDYRDSLIDSPANNFAVLNALVTTHNLSEGNLRVDCDNSTLAIPSTLLAPSGKWYGEILINDLAGSNTYVRIGVVTADGIGKDLGGVTGTFAFLGDGRTYSQGSVAIYGTAVSTGDVFQVALDNDNGKLWFGLNGTWMASGDPAAGNNPSLTFTAGEQMGFAVASGSGGFSPDFTANFGQDSTFSGARPAGGNVDDNGIGDFAYPVPSGGYLALCSANLPTPSIVDGSEHFNTVLWTGDGTTDKSKIITVGFQSDFIWQKPRTTADSHSLVDSVRGFNLVMNSNGTSAEVDRPLRIADVDATSFAVADAASNANGVSNVGWSWKAGGTAVSNTDGSITSQVSANVDAGFSIVSYTGTGANATVGHSLGVQPSMIIVKNRDTATWWDVYHGTLGGTKYLRLNSTNGEFTGSVVWNNTDPTSSVFSVGTVNDVNASGENYIAYCFANSDIIKAGSYTGNGSSDGVFVFTGGRVQWLMIKRTDGAAGWYMEDASRNEYNVVDKYLTAESSDAESTLSLLDFVSNGFKLRTSSTGFNASGGTYIYLAIMESPLKISNAR